MNPSEDTGAEQRWAWPKKLSSLGPNTDVLKTTLVSAEVPPDPGHSTKSPPFSCPSKFELVSYLPEVETNPHWCSRSLEEWPGQRIEKQMALYLNHGHCSHVSTGIISSFLFLPLSGNVSKTSVIELWWWLSEICAWKSSCAFFALFCSQQY